MVLNDAGKIAFDEWEKLPKRFPNFELDVFQIMPNHMHGIIVLNDVVGATLAVAHDSIAQNDNYEMGNDNGARDDDGNKGARASRARTGNATVGDIVGAYKSLVANECLKIYKTKINGAGDDGNERVRVNRAPTRIGKLWQRNYYEHIIRDEQSYQTISNYIIDNPAKWNDDKFFVG